jgi:hypothetical protein
MIMLLSFNACITLTVSANQTREHGNIAAAAGAAATAQKETTDTITVIQHPSFKSNQLRSRQLSCLHSTHEAML